MTQTIVNQEVDESAVDDQSIFDKKVQLLTNYFHQLCSEHGIVIGILSMVLDEAPNNPIILKSGSNQEIVYLTAYTTGTIRREINAQLDNLASGDRNVRMVQD